MNGTVNKESIIWKKLLLHLFQPFYMQRWNDKLRPFELVEMDKQAHKMMIAFLLGCFCEEKYEEEKNRKNRKEFPWMNLIWKGILDLLDRIAITDIKPSVIHFIQVEHSPTYEELKKWASIQVNEFKKKIEDLISKDGIKLEKKVKREEEIDKILEAAHFLATKWEWENVLDFANRTVPESEKIRDFFSVEPLKYINIPGFKEVLDVPVLRDFISLLGQLRFQKRWAQRPRIPATSVLGHSYYVAILSYLFTLKCVSLRGKVNENQANKLVKRIFLNFFTGLFHDFPEVYTRDIITPIKKVGELNKIIKDLEALEMKKLYDRLTNSPALTHKMKIKLINYLKLFTGTFELNKTDAALEKTPPEFMNVYREDKEKNKEKKDEWVWKQTTIEAINKEIKNRRSNDGYWARDGELVKFADELALYIEAYEALRNGGQHEDYEKVRQKILEKYEVEVSKIGGLKFSDIYGDIKINPSIVENFIKMGNAYYDNKKYRDANSIFQKSYRY